jgi:predicted nucleic acid-binding protein
MTMLVVDSSVLIEHLRGKRSATTFLRRHIGRGPVLVPALAAWELWKGAEKPREKEAVYSLLTALTPDPFTPAMSQLAGELHLDHRRRGVERPAFDLLIASHALHHDAPLATLDRDYSSIAGLDVISVDSM